MHSDQGVTADTTHTVLGENASRGLLYVAMTRGRQANTARVCQRIIEGNKCSREPVATSVHTRGAGFDAGDLLCSVVACDRPAATAHDHVAQMSGSVLPLSVQARSAQRAKAVGRRVQDYQVRRAERQTIVHDTGLAHMEHLRQACARYTDGGLEL